MAQMCSTLGISTNTRLLGLAIITQKGLVEYSIRLHKSVWSPSKANLIITSLEPCVRPYSLKSVVLSIPHAHHQTEAFKELVTAIQKYFRKENIPLYNISQEEVYTLCPKNEKKTKTALMKALVLQYPQLSYCYHKEVRNKNRYYIKLFEAVAVATLHAQEQ